MRSLGLVLLLFVPGTRVLDVSPGLSTQPVGQAVGDVAVWRHLILATNHAPAPDGALIVYGPDGKARQTISGLDRPHSLDIDADIVAVSERGKNQLRLYRIESATGRLADAGVMPVFEGQSGDAAQITGVGLYRRKSDAALFAIVLRRGGPEGSRLWEYRLTDDGSLITARKVREFGKLGAKAPATVGTVAVDDTEGYVYFSEEGCCLHKYHADPDRSGAALEVARHATDKFQGLRKGIALSSGWLMVADRITGKSEIHFYAKRGAAIRPLFILKGPADATEAIEYVSTFPGFPDGALLAINTAGRNVLVFPLKSRY